MINIYGKGGHAKMISSLVPASSMYCNSDYTDASQHPWIVGIGDNIIRKKISLDMLNSSAFINVIKATYIASDISLGHGILIAPGSVIQNGVFIGNHTIVNTSASIDHDCVIGTYCHIAPNATLCGSVMVGEGTLIGAGSIVLPGIEIGNNCIIGAGSVVTKNVPSDTIAYGNPIKIK